MSEKNHTPSSQLNLLGLLSDDAPELVSRRKLSRRAIDLTGQVFHEWIVIGPAELSDLATQWICRCKCGVVKAVDGGALRRGHTKSCRQCFIKRKTGHAQDLTGKKFGRWTVVRRSFKVNRQRRVPLWVCMCDCGKESEVTRSNLIGKSSLGCKACKGEDRRNKITVGDRSGSFQIVGGPVCRNEKLYYECRCDCGTIREMVSTVFLSGTRTRCKNCMMVAKNGPWNLHFFRIRVRAERKGIEFSVSLEFITSLLAVQSYRCKLSGLPLAISDKTRNGSETTASLDRIDSTKGYTPDNVQWVHKHINKMKQSFSDEQFLRLCSIVAEHNKATS